MIFEDESSNLHLLLTVPIPVLINSLFYHSSNISSTQGDKVGSLMIHSKRVVSQ